jgi:hypothetical protein
MCAAIKTGNGLSLISYDGHRAPSGVHIRRSEKFFIEINLNIYEKKRNQKNALAEEKFRARAEEEKKIFPLQHTDKHTRKRPTASQRPTFLPIRLLFKFNVNVYLFSPRLLSITFRFIGNFVLLHFFISIIEPRV